MRFLRIVAVLLRAGVTKRTKTTTMMYGESTVQIKRVKSNARGARRGLIEDSSDIFQKAGEGWHTTRPKIDKIQIDGTLAPLSYRTYIRKPYKTVLKTYIRHVKLKQSTGTKNIQ